MRLCFSNEEPIITNHSIFLAGPTRRNSDYMHSWRKEATKLLEEMNFDGVVYIPEYSTGNKFDQNKIEKQTKWEWRCLDAAGVIVFWIPRTLPDMPAFTTNVEFGIYTEKKPDKIILGYPESAEKMRYLEIRYKNRINEMIYNTLKDTLKAAIRKLS